MSGPSKAKSLVALGAMLFFIAAMVITGMGIFELNRTKNDSIGLRYIIPAELMNTMSVVFLIYLTTTIPENSTGYRLLVVFLLLAGLIAEIYLTVYSEKTTASVFAYLVMITNFVFRGFILLQYIQLTGWETPVFPEMKSIVESVKPSPKPAAESKSAPESKPAESKQEEPGKEYKPLLRALIEKIKVNNPDVDEKTVQTAKSIIGSEVSKSGHFGKEEIRRVNDIIKNKNGSDITPVFSF